MQTARRSLLLAALFCFAVLFASACAAQNTGPGAAPQQEVQFLDSSSFDRKLSTSLAANQAEVNVVFPATITLNNIPERMDKWLSKVEKFGGTVEIQAEPEQGRELFSTIFSLFIKAYDAIEEAFIYSPAKNYNAILYYKAKTGIVTRLAFVRKASPGQSPSGTAPAAKMPMGQSSAGK